MADGLPYVGSLMSLVTHNGARYEGVLSSIDMPNSSITLSGGTQCMRVRLCLRESIGTG
jgi:hypothetical protein